MSELFLDVLGNMELVDGYQIEDSIAQKYNLKPGSICPFTHLRVETLSPEKVRKTEESGRLKKIKQQKKPLGKETPSAVNSKISGRVAKTKATTKKINQTGESHDFARSRARSGRGPVRRNLILEREEVRMATVKKVPAKPAKAAAKAPAKAKTKAPVKAPAKSAAKPVKAKAKAVAKAPVKAKAKVVAKAPAKAKAKAPVKAKSVAKKPAAKKPAKAKK